MKDREDRFSRGRLALGESGGDANRLRETLASVQLGLTLLLSKQGLLLRLSLTALALFRGHSLATVLDAGTLLAGDLLKELGRPVIGDTGIIQVEKTLGRHDQLDRAHVLGPPGHQVVVDLVDGIVGPELLLHHDELLIEILQTPPEEALLLSLEMVAEAADRLLQRRLVAVLLEVLDFGVQLSEQCLRYLEGGKPPSDGLALFAQELQELRKSCLADLLSVHDKAPPSSK